MNILSFNQSLAVKNENNKAKINNMSLSSSTVKQEKDTINFTSISSLNPETRAVCKAFINEIKPMDKRILELIGSFKYHLAKNNLFFNIEQCKVSFKVNPESLDKAVIDGYKVGVRATETSRKSGNSDLSKAINNSSGDITGKTAKEAILNLILELGEGIKVPNKKTFKTTISDFAGKLGIIKVKQPNTKKIEILPQEIVTEANLINYHSQHLYDNWEYLEFKNGIDPQDKGDLLESALYKLFSNIENPYKY